MVHRLLAAAVFAVAASSAFAQVQRNFPQDALRGVIVVTDPPRITLNKDSATLSPGARIRGQDNLQVMSGALVGQKLLANYTVDGLGQVSAVWILTAAELDKRWPTNRKEAANWVFDPVAQTWTKP